MSSLKVIGSRLCLLTKHDAILLLRHCIATPRVLYTLRTAPCFQSPYLEDFDFELRSILSTVLNINLDNDLVWSQATLPVRNGGIGVTYLKPSTTAFIVQQDAPPHLWPTQNSQAEFCFKTDCLLHPIPVLLPVKASMLPPGTSTRPHRVCHFQLQVLHLLCCLGKKT